MIKRQNMFPKSINIKWKLTLWAAFLMIFLFLSYTILQYFVIQNWELNQEKQTIEKKMEEITSYIKESSTERDISETRALFGYSK